MRGDLFSLLDPDPDPGRDSGRAVVTPQAIIDQARALARRVERGERAPGVPAVMACLADLASTGDAGHGPSRSFVRLGEIRERLSSWARRRGDALPWPVVRSRALVLPRDGGEPLHVSRVIPCGEASHFVLTRQVEGVKPGLKTEPITDFSSLVLATTAAGDEAKIARVRAAEALELLEGLDVGDATAGTALAAAQMDPVRVIFRLFRFGERGSDVRTIMRIIQEPGTYRRVLCASDGCRVALMSRDVVGVFDAAGTTALSGRVPIDMDPDVGAEVTSIALERDVLGACIRPKAGAVAELALLDLTEKKGFPVGGVGQEASHLCLAERRAYIIDGFNLLRLPLLSGTDDGIKVFNLRPWFAEYPWRPGYHLGFDGQRVWVSNGRKLVIIDEGLEMALNEVALPSPITDMHIDPQARELQLVTLEESSGVVRVVTYEIGEAK